jgi:hypothetical protein
LAGSDPKLRSMFERGSPEERLASRHYRRLDIQGAGLGFRSEILDQSRGRLSCSSLYQGEFSFPLEC